MSRVIKFAYVMSPHGRVAHMASGRVEGDRTYCGRTLRKGWRFTTSRLTEDAPLCIACQEAKP